MITPMIAYHEEDEHQKQNKCKCKIKVFKCLIWGNVFCFNGKHKLNMVARRENCDPRRRRLENIHFLTEFHWQDVSWSRLRVEFLNEMDRDDKINLNLQFKILYIGNSKIFQSRMKGNIGWFSLMLSYPFHDAGNQQIVSLLTALRKANSLDEWV